MTFPIRSDTESFPHSRRRFLLGLAAGGGALTSSLLTGCGGKPEHEIEAADSTPAAAEGLVLKASRFTAAPDGRSREVGELLRYHQQLARHLHAQDRVHTYGSFHIAELAA